MSGPRCRAYRRISRLGNPFRQGRGPMTLRSWIDVCCFACRASPTNADAAASRVLVCWFVIVTAPLGCARYGMLLSWLKLMGVDSGCSQTFRQKIIGFSGVLARALGSPRPDAANPAGVPGVQDGPLLVVPSRRSRCSIPGHRLEIGRFLNFRNSPRLSEPAPRSKTQCILACLVACARSRQP
jgi:hypothetical protein